MTTRPGDLPEGGDERLEITEQVVLKPQNLPEQFRMLADSPPAQGRPAIPDRMAMVYQTDRLPRDILETIRTNSGLQEITVVECTEENGWLMYWGRLYVPDSDSYAFAL